MLNIDPSMNPTKGNFEHRELYEYDLMDGLISEAGTNYDLNASKIKARTVLN